LAGWSVDANNEYFVHIVLNFKHFHFTDIKRPSKSLQSKVTYGPKSEHYCAA
jgi:hypothetical protein